MGLCQKWLPIGYSPKSEETEPSRKHHMSGLLAAFLALNPPCFFFQHFWRLGAIAKRAVHGTRGPSDLVLHTMTPFWIRRFLSIDQSTFPKSSDSWLDSKTYMFNHGLTSWLVGGWPTYPSEKWWSEWVTVGMMKFPTFYGKSNQIPWFQSPPTRYIVIPIISHYKP